MKLTLKFGMHEPPRIANWWDDVAKFHPYVMYKNRKWEFAMYDEDPTGDTAYICIFSEITGFDPNWHATMYVNIDHLLFASSGCECGAEYTSFSWDHMRFCPKWRKW